MFTRYFHLRKTRAHASAGQWEEVFRILAQEKLTGAERGNFIEAALRQHHDDIALRLFQMPGVAIESETSLAHLATLMNCPLFLEAILSAGEDVHKPNADEITLLEMASFKGHLVCLDIIIRYGATADDWSSTVFRNLTDEVKARLNRLGVKTND